MRWFGLVLLCAVIVNICGDPDPDPKKYNKVELKPSIKNNDSTLTDEERQFLREVEAKFGIKSEVPLEKKEEEGTEIETKVDESLKPTIATKLPFPAVIAIEIVNDTDTKATKGKRTIDANLGYGFRTNSGYTYRYLGKPAQEQGKFMIYPYSQEDIPPASSASSNEGYPKQVGQTIKISPNVEITPSQAYELVPNKEEESTSYNYEKPDVQLNTKYENIQGVEAPPPPYPNHNSQQTLYTTYNGQQFSGLSNQFPKVMSNYLVDPSQLLNNPTYQGAGITQDHLRPHGAQLEQRVVPVLVLRVPSSYIKDPSAELYANLPKNYPLSQYLNNVNLQELVNQYFKKIGYPSAPKVMAYPTSSLIHPSSHMETAASPVSAYQPQHYASPYVRPSYTHADYSGVQYSAVQPVMAKYPTGYTKAYYVMRPQSLYQQPLQHQNYMYRYKYVPQPQTYYTQSHQSQYQQEVEQPRYQHVEEDQPQYQQEEQAQYQQEPEQETQYHKEAEHQNQYQQEAKEEQLAHSNDEQSHSDDTQKAHIEYQSSSTDEEHDSSAGYQYSSPQKHQQYQSSSNDEEQDTPAGYKYPSPQKQQENEHEDEHQHITPGYQSVSSSTPSYEHSPEAATPDYGPTKVPLSYRGSTPSVQISYQEPSQKETVAIFPRSQTGHKADAALNYIYQKVNNEDSGSESLVLHENYPSKDHTIATVLPLSYKRPQHSEPVQSVSYVTPVTTMKYHSHYRVMVPQTILRQPTDEKVTYVNSHSIPSGYSSLASSNLGSSSHYQSIDPEEAASHFASALSKLRSSSYPSPSFSSSSYPRSSYTHHKRMTKPENKSDSSATTRKTERNEKKKSS
ncbi:hypothetical protein O0L34_g13941 [Tuta absoluta]|nr:hypothetical protein O0L34_g13941 [Tuta absoluta]